MLPRNAADYRSILWALLMPTVLIAQYANPRLVTYLWPLSFYFAMAAGTMAHNHNHCPTFKSKRMNNLWALWISLFYGYPSFAWIPTHNLNHHKHVNREGDATITWRHTNRNTWYVAVSYFFVSAYYQSAPIKEYIAKAKAKNPTLYRTIVTQYAVWIATLVGLFALAIAMHGWGTGFKVFALSFGLPTLFGPWSMMWFNYMQHVHADPWSEHNHSRNITGRIFNFLVFNNGLHTIHHEHPGSHWSTAYTHHAEIADKVDPALNWRSFWWWVFRGYVITAFLPSLETKQIGRAPFDPPAGKRVAMREQGPMTDSVDALEAGNNAQMA
jgi:beta-carotene hydroxylase